MQRHWLVTLQNLSSTGRSWDENVSRALLQDEQCGDVNVLPGLNGDIHWQLSLQRNGKVFHLNGAWQANLKRECSRCNAEFDCEQSGKTERIFQFIGKHRQDDNAEKDEQVGEYIEHPGMLNLIDVLREDVWLAWNDVICSETCQGLCQGCGVNLNDSDCQCKQDDSNNPFAALRGLDLND